MKDARDDISVYILLNFLIYDPCVREMTMLKCVKISIFGEFVVSEQWKEEVEMMLKLFLFC